MSALAMRTHTPWVSEVMSVLRTGWRVLGVRIEYFGRNCPSQRSCPSHRNWLQIWSEIQLVQETDFRAQEGQIPMYRSSSPKASTALCATRAPAARVHGLSADSPWSNRRVGTLLRQSALATTSVKEKTDCARPTIAERCTDMSAKMTVTVD